LDAPWLDEDTIERNIQKYIADKQERIQQLDAILGQIVPDRERLPRSLPPKPIYPKVAILDRVQALCRLCHLCKHYKCIAKTPRQLRGGAVDIMYHWCEINRRSQLNFIEHYRNQLHQLKGCLVIEINYSGYEELGEFKTIKEWQEYRQDEADLYNKNLDIYLTPPIWAGL
jgi:hypothetical protein